MSQVFGPAQFVANVAEVPVTLVEGAKVLKETTSSRKLKRGREHLWNGIQILQENQDVVPTERLRQLTVDFVG